MTRALIIGGAPVAGNDRFYELLIADADLLIAADSGGLACQQAGRAPDVLVGDLDSISAETLLWIEERGVETRISPIHKDVSDLDLALEAARDLGCSRVTITAAWSRRLDHTLAAIGALTRESELVTDIVDPGLAGWLLTPQTRSSIRIGPEGALCSLFALGSPAVVSSAGMRYELSELALSPLSSVGLSNIVVAPTALVTVHEGTLIILSNPESDGTLAYLDHNSG